MITYTNWIIVKAMGSGNKYLSTNKAVAKTTSKQLLHKSDILSVKEEFTKLCGPPKQGIQGRFSFLFRF